MTKLKTDLHIHTRHSVSHKLDLTPKELIDEAEKQGFKVISITDHNSIDAYFENINGKNIIDYAEDLNIILVPGLELTPLSIFGGPFHILVYGDALLEINPKKVLKNPSFKDIIKFCENIKKIGNSKIVIAHPYFFFCVLYVPSSNIIIRALGELLNYIDGVEVNYAHPLELNRFVVDNLSTELEKFLRKNIITTVGSDTHHLRDFGKFFGLITKNVKSVDEVFQALEMGYINPELSKCYMLKKEIKNPDFLKKCIHVAMNSLSDLVKL